MINNSQQKAYLTGFLRTLNSLLMMAISTISIVSYTAAKTTMTLKSDGPNQGLDAYQLIQNFAGKRAIEAPDLYLGNHTDSQHIFERFDDIVGNHFVFTIHRDLDKDRDKFVRFSDRQRNEIKAYARSNDQLKGFKGETLLYTWKFKVGEGMTVSKNFSHFFQLKSVDDGVGMPILTLSGANRKKQDLFALAHAAVQKASLLRTIAWQDIRGKWLQVKCKVTYRDNGSLSIEITDLQSQTKVLSYSNDNIDMWRGTKAEHFVRPKWGIYRSLKSKELLREKEEEVSFADFSVTKF